MKTEDSAVSLAPAPPLRDGVLTEAAIRIGDFLNSGFSHQLYMSAALAISEENGSAGASPSSNPGGDFLSSGASQTRGCENAGEGTGTTGVAIP
jgi:hypothetical protein